MVYLRFFETHFFIIFLLQFFNDIDALENEAIVGGKKSHPCKYKYQVSITLNGNHLCGGTILNDNYVVTAAHCVLEEKGHFIGLKLNVIAGTSDLDKLCSPTVKSQVDKVYLHSKHVPGTMTADIAVLRLKKSLGIDENPCLDKVQLPDSDEENYVNKEAVITGYGSISLTDTREFGVIEKLHIVPQSKLYSLTTRVIPNVECRGKYLVYKRNFMKQVPLVKIDDTFICVQAVNSFHEPPRGSCVGDSGGPVVTDDNVLIGIIGIGPLNCDEYYAPGAHTRVSKYLKFIEQALNDDKNCHDVNTEPVTVCIMQD